ncbi:hypothetical protein GGI11_001950 [Coemansia sp. RSA 2049]|nr:hypothetical protein H4217_003901 [Coemansia sp. RSA 1939]KAJ2521655.1 hypothetical protein GGI11_001950 [Coemansia sp. RSA 2049]KAJ2610935.1 hypothetical protein EV177_003728 [Coemansia sp. RSA 1804]KAJ2688390.1 hypothetical protein GGH99_003046 [Coemansia sp. RSA 1285]
MEAANKLSRQASEYESNCVWDKAETKHREAANAYRSVVDFEFDPVATLTLTSLTNKHIRWAEYCKREKERQSELPESKVFAQTRQSSEIDSALVEEAPLDTAARNDGKEDHEFEEFWRYMQNWLANPTAFTGTGSSSAPSRRSGNITALGADAGGTPRNVMESFYLVGANPDQSASIYGTVAASPRAASPLTTLNEADEDSPPHESSVVIQDRHNMNPASTRAQVLSSGYNSGGQTNSEVSKERANEALRSENQRLQKLVLVMNERIRTLETAAQENTMLKSSIHSFREEFHRHAGMGAAPRISKNTPGLVRHGAPLYPSANSSNDEYVRRLEQQIQVLQSENTKQKSQVTKYKERWERLKESAKRKRQQQELEMLQK